MSCFFSFFRSIDFIISFKICISSKVLTNFMERAFQYRRHSFDVFIEVISCYLNPCLCFSRVFSFVQEHKHRVHESIESSLPENTCNFLMRAKCFFYVKTSTTLPESLLLFSIGTGLCSTFFPSR